MLRNIITKLKRLVTPASKAEVVRGAASRTSKISLWQMLNRGSKAKEEAAKENENVCKNVIEKIFDQEKSKHIEKKDVNDKVNMKATTTAYSIQKSTTPPIIKTTINSEPNISKLTTEVEKNLLKVPITDKAQPILNVASFSETGKKSDKAELVDKVNDNKKAMTKNQAIPKIDEMPVKINTVGETNSSDITKVIGIKKNIETDKKVLRNDTVVQMNASKLIEKKDNIEEIISATKIDSRDETKQVKQSIIKNEKDIKSEIGKSRSDTNLQSPLMEKANEKIRNKLELETEYACKPSPEIDNILKAFGVNSKIKEKYTEVISEHKGRRSSDASFDSTVLDYSVNKKDNQCKEKGEPLQLNLNKSSQFAKDILENSFPVKEGVRAGREKLLKKIALESNTLTALGGQCNENSPHKKIEISSAFDDNKSINAPTKSIENKNVTQTKADEVGKTSFKSSTVEPVCNQALNDIVHTSQSASKTIPVIMESVANVNTSKSEKSAAYFKHYTTDFEKVNASEQDHSNLKEMLMKLNTAEYNYHSPSAEDAVAQMRPTRPDAFTRDSITKMQVSEFEDPNNPISRWTTANANISDKDVSGTHDERPCDGCGSLACPYPPKKRMSPRSKEAKDSRKQNTDCAPGPVSVKPYNPPQMRCFRNYGYPECPARPGWNYGCRYGRLCPFCMRYGLCKWPTCSEGRQSKSLSTPYTVKANAGKSGFDSRHVDSGSGQRQPSDSSTCKCQSASGDAVDFFTIDSNSSKTCGIIPPSIIELNSLYSRMKITNFLTRNYNMLHEKVSSYFKKKDVDLGSNVILKGKKTFDPWSPMPSWPAPKIKKRNVPDCPPGCRLLPLPRLRPIEGNPCDILPRPYGHGHADHYIVLMGTKRNG